MNKPQGGGGGAGVGAKEQLQQYRQQQQQCRHKLARRNFGEKKFLRSRSSRPTQTFPINEIRLHKEILWARNKSKNRLTHTYIY